VLSTSEKCTKNTEVKGTTWASQRLGFGGFGEGFLAPQPVAGTFQTDNLGVMDQTIDQGSDMVACANPRVSKSGGKQFKSRFCGPGVP